MLWGREVMLRGCCGAEGAPLRCQEVFLHAPNLKIGLELVVPGQFLGYLPPGGLAVPSSELAFSEHFVGVQFAPRTRNPSRGILWEHRTGMAREPSPFPWQLPAQRNVTRSWAPRDAFPFLPSFLAPLGTGSALHGSGSCQEETQSSWGAPWGRCRGILGLLPRPPPTLGPAPGGRGDAPCSAPVTARLRWDEERGHGGVKQIPGWFSACIQQLQIICEHPVARGSPAVGSGRAPPFPVTSVLRAPAGRGNVFAQKSWI